MHSFWNVDYSDALRLYSVKATNTLEATFLALTNYELYVSEHLYERYYTKIIGKRPPADFSNYKPY